MSRMFPLVILAVLATGASAQINHPHSEVGINTVPDPLGCETVQVEATPFTQFDAYVVLTDPFNERRGRPVATVGGFEFRLEVPPSVFLLTSSFPPGCLGLPEPGPDYMTGCPASVTGRLAVLMTFRVMPTTFGTVFFHLAPVQSVPPSIPGEMAFLDPDDDFSLHVMHPVSGSADVPVFAINWGGEVSFCATVPVRGASFGAVKTLYR